MSEDVASVSGLAGPPWILRLSSGAPGFVSVGRGLAVVLSGCPALFPSLDYEDDPSIDPLSVLLSRRIRFDGIFDTRLGPVV